MKRKTRRKSSWHQLIRLEFASVLNMNYAFCDYVTSVSANVFYFCRIRMRRMRENFLKNVTVLCIVVCICFNENAKMYLLFPVLSPDLFQAERITFKLILITQNESLEPNILNEKLKNLKKGFFAFKLKKKWKWGKRKWRKIVSIQS